MSKAIRGIVILILTATACGCSIYAGDRGFLAAKTFELDKPKEAVKDITLDSLREYGFSITVVKEGREGCFVAHNRREAPVSVLIRITAEENLGSDREFPFYYVVPPKSDICIARVFPLDKKKDEYRYNAEKSFMLGDYTARHSPQRGYRVPWAKGETYIVSQAPGGPLVTHLESGSRNALDFTMPTGTPIHAARGGIVIGIEDSHKVGGFDKVFADKANYVDILHDDGTVASYAHLAPLSVVVRVGQRVAEGEKLALSGSTGYSSGPHLHFSVWQPQRTEDSFERVSIPIQFCSDGSPQCYSPRYLMALSTEGIVRDPSDDEKILVASKDKVPSLGKATKAKTPSLDLDLVPVKGGCFTKGSGVSKATKTCVNDFSIGRYEVTQGEWQQIMGSNPAYFNQCGPDCPVENVSWDEVQRFIKELNKQTGKKYRLPTEDEWEFAARSGGKRERFSGSDNADAAAWYKGNSNRQIHPVGQKQPNGLGLYDMSGNVWEWVADWWSEKKQPNGKQQGISQPPKDSSRLLRGGSWSNVQEDILTTLQGLNAEPGTRSKEIGLRLAESW